MDKCTFLDSKAAQNLTIILNDSKYNIYSPKISKILSKYFTYTSGIMFIPNKTIRDATLNIYRKEFIRKIIDLDLPEVIKTHTLNVIVAQNRKCLRETETRKGNYNVMRRYKKEKILE